MRISELLDHPDRIVSLIEQYETFILASEDNVRITGKTLEEVNREQPVFYWHASQKHAECQNVVKLLEARTDQKRSVAFKKIKESSDRSLADRTIEKYVDSEQEVMDQFCLYLELCNCRDKLAAIVEAYKARGYALKNIVEVRVASIHQAVL